ncbi:unnamed protein product [Musa hybrid cultivar]
MLTRGGSGNQCDCSNGHSGIPCFVNSLRNIKYYGKLETKTLRTRKGTVSPRACICYWHVYIIFDGS